MRDDGNWPQTDEDSHGQTTTGFGPRMARMDADDDEVGMERKWGDVD